MNNKSIYEVLSLVKFIVLNPQNVFKEIKRGNYFYEIQIVFVCGVLITLIKSFFDYKRTISFFRSDILNSVLSFLSIPQIKWIYTYLIYFLFLYFLLFLCRFLFKNLQIKTFFFSMMAISGVGVLVQLLFFGLRLIISKQLASIFSYLVLVWVIILSVKCIQSEQNIPIFKATIVFIIAAIPAFVLVGFTGIFPYLAWLTF